MEASLAPAAYSGTSHGVEVTAWAGCRISSRARACCRAALRCVGVGVVSRLAAAESAEGGGQAAVRRRPRGGERGEVAAQHLGRLDELGHGLHQRLADLW